MKQFLLTILFSCLAFGQIQKPAYMYYNTEKGDTLEIIPSGHKFIQSYIFGLPDSLDIHSDTLWSHNARINAAIPYSDTTSSIAMQWELDGKLNTSSVKQGAYLNDTLKTGWFNVRDYGSIDTTGVTDCSSVITAAIAALNARGSGVLYFPQGKYKTAGGFTITANATILGTGMGITNLNDSSAATLIYCTSATANLFTVTSTGHVLFENIGLKNISSTTPSNGSGIKVLSTNYANKVDYKSISVYGFYVNIDVQTGEGWIADNIIINNPVLYGLKIQNTLIADAGDWCIINSFFWTEDRAATSAIRIESSGGGKISNCKINCGYPANKYYSYGIDLYAASSTIILKINSCSIESFSASGIRLQNTAGVWHHISILGTGIGIPNNASGYGIEAISHTLGSLDNIAVTGCVFYGKPTGYAVGLTNIDNLNMIGCVKRTVKYWLTQTGCTNIIADTLSDSDRVIKVDSTNYPGYVTLTNHVTKVSKSDSTNYPGYTTITSANTRVLKSDSTTYPGYSTLTNVNTRVLKSDSATYPGYATLTSLAAKAALSAPTFTGKITTDSITVNGSGYFGGAITNTARVGIKNGLLANALSVVNSRNQAIASIDSSGVPTFGTLAGLIKGTAGVFSGVAAGTSSQYVRADLTMQTLNQAAVAGLTTSSTPTFSNITPSALATGSIPYKTASTLSNSPIWTDALLCGINTTTGTAQFNVKERAVIGASSACQGGGGCALVMSTGGTYTGATSLNYKVQLDGGGPPNTFKWSDDGGSTWDATTVAVTGSPQTLNNGITITFDETSGGDVGDYYTFSTTVNPAISVLDRSGYGSNIRSIVSASRTYDCGSIAAGVDSVFTITCNGAIAGNPVSVGISVAAEAGTVVTAECTSANTVSVRISNHFSVAAVDPASKVYKVCIINF